MDYFLWILRFVPDCAVLVALFIVATDLIYSYTYSRHYKGDER